jgi:two-component system, chemotaxis family, protein-glutamate methylesterase/glutaminase
MIKEKEIIVIGGSAGSYNVVRNLLGSLPEGFRIPIVLCLHRLKAEKSGFDDSLNLVSRIPVIEPMDKQPVAEGYVYLGPANYHLLIEKNRTFALSIGAEENYSRPAIDCTFDTAADAFGKRLIVILLSGANVDGAQGIRNAFLKGALTIVQDPEEALFKIMPEAALKLFTPHKILTSSEIINLLKNDLNL